MKLPNFNFKKVAIISTCVLIFGLLNSYLIFPKILKFMLKRNLQLKPGSQMRPMFDKIPFPLDFKVYMFNLTNPKEVMEGKNPKVQEIGPYVFEEWKDKLDMVESDEDDTIEFTLKNTYIFRPDLSNGLTGNEILTMPHLVIFGALMSVKRDRAPMLPLVSKALTSLFKPETPFMTEKVMDVLFHGIDINCDTQEFSAKAVCASLESETKGMKIVNETFFRLGIFASRNATRAGKYLVYRGIKNIADLGRVIKFNDEPELDVWDGDECNKIVGTDSTIFPPFMKKEDGIWAFEADVCRSMGAHYVRKSRYAGMPTSYYSLDLGDLKNQPELHCFCNDPPDDCPPKGTMDLLPCMSAPIYASKPHFLDTDPDIAAKIEGLSPDVEKHDVFIEFELISGTPLSAAKRLQFNMEMEPIEEFPLMKNVTKAFVPLFWVEEGVSLNKTYTNLLKYQLFLALKFNSVMKWLSIIGGIGGIALAGYLFQVRSNDPNITQITSIAPKSADSASTSSEEDKKNMENNLKISADRNSAVLGLSSDKNGSKIESNSQLRF